MRDAMEDTCECRVHLVEGAGHAGVTDDRLNLREVLREWRGPMGTVNDLAVAADWSLFVTVENGAGDEDGETSGGPCLVFDMT